MKHALQGKIVDGKRVWRWLTSPPAHMPTGGSPSKGR
jgi:hypothetical protein